MTAFVPVKSMSRKLTAAEEKTIGDYLVANPDAPFDKVIDRFESEFQTPITHTCVTRIALKRSGQE